MKLFFMGAWLLVCSLSTIAQKVGLPVIYQGENPANTIRQATQLKPPLQLNPTATTNSTLTALTGRYLTAFCISHGPFTFITFTAQRKDDQSIALAFETTDEYTSNNFIIERVLAKGTEHKEVAQPSDTCFSLLYKTGVVTGFGEISKKYARNLGYKKAKYELTDDNSYTGISFYRITEVDNDQTTLSTKIIAVMGKPLMETIGVSPNPAVSEAGLQLFSKTADDGIVQVLNAQGVLLKETPMAIAAGNNTLQVPVAGFSSGMYYIRVVRKHSAVMQTRFMKL